MNHFVHCCSFSTRNKITSKGCQSASKTCDFDAKNAKIFWGGGTAPSPDPSPNGEGDTPSPQPTPLGASTLTPPFWNSAYATVDNRWRMLSTCCDGCAILTTWDRQRPDGPASATNTQQAGNDSRRLVEWAKSLLYWQCYQSSKNSVYNQWQLW